MMKGIVVKGLKGAGKVAGAALAGVVVANFSREGSKEMTESFKQGKNYASNAWAERQANKEAEALEATTEEESA